MSETKPTNPKDAIGSNKLPLHLFPTTAKVYGCLGLLDGALKYGRSNFRAMGVRASIYYDAVGRHMDAWFEGEDFAPDSGLPHLAHAIAGIAILIEAIEVGNMTDDRMFPLDDEGGFRNFVEWATPFVKALKNQHKDKDLHHYTIEDGEEYNTDPEPEEGVTPEFKEQFDTAFKEELEQELREKFGASVAGVQAQFPMSSQEMADSYEDPLIAERNTMGVQFPMSSNSIDIESYSPDDCIDIPGSWEDVDPEVETLTGCFEYEDGCEHCENISLREQLDGRDEEIVAWKKKVEELVGDKVLLENQFRHKDGEIHELTGHLKDVVFANGILREDTAKLRDKNSQLQLDVTALGDRVCQLELDKAALLKGVGIRKGVTDELNARLDRNEHERRVANQRQLDTVRQLTNELANEKMRVSELECMLLEDNELRF